MGARHRTAGLEIDTMNRAGVAASLVLCALAACAPRESNAPAQQEASVTLEPFGVTPDGDSVELFTLTNAHGVELRAMTYGGIIVSLKVPDRDGAPGDVVLGHDSLQGYLESSPYFGAIVGRYANRIARGRFTLHGRTYRLATNNGPNALHGGLRGFDKVVWEGQPFRDSSGVGVVLHHVSPDGDEGYPGALDVTVRYTLTDSNDVVLDYTATTTSPTPVNLSQHSYFNLAGGGSILDHVLTIVHAGGLDTHSDRRDRAGGGNTPRLPDAAPDRRADRRQRCATEDRRRLRPQLRAHPRRHRPGAGGPARRPRERAGAAGLHHPAGAAVLLRQLS
jgi:galactose mutarotase-like enzyme